jgi:hypothetical protein
MTPTEAYAANLRALAELATPTSDDSALTSYQGWTDPQVRAEGFDAIGEPKSEVAAAYARLGLTADLSWDANRLVVPVKLGETITALACCYRSTSVPAHCVIGGDWPRSLRGLTIEPDPIRARILWRLFPTRDIRNAPITAAGIAAPCFDLITGSVPTDGAIGPDVLAPPEMRHASLRIAAPDYWLCRAVSMLRSGGVLALIVPTVVLDRPEPGVREWLHARTETIRMWRLPVEALGVGADLVMLRRR